MLRMTAVLLFAGVTLLASCSGSERDRANLPQPVERIKEFAEQVDSADLARIAIARHGCSTCHLIPGIPGANGRVGPPLTNAVDQVYIAGVLPNTPENLVVWIRNPQAIDPRSAMPDLGVSEREARAIAAYLYKTGGD